MFNLINTVYASGAGTTGTGTGTGTGGLSGTIMSVGWIVILFALMYFMLIRPQKKQQKEMQKMISALEVGDKIVTIGGMIGKVVHVSADKLTFETGEDRVRIEITKWAISSNEGKGANKETTDSEESLQN